MKFVRRPGAVTLPWALSEVPPIDGRFLGLRSATSFAWHITGWHYRYLAPFELGKPYLVIPWGA